MAVRWEQHQRTGGPAVRELDEASADAVAAELGITANAVFIVRSRVMVRLRQEAAGLIDS